MGKETLIEPIQEVESTLGFNNSNITNCCRGRYKSMYGYKWKYKQ